MNTWKELLHQGLRDDGWPWDWTTLGVLGQGVGKDSVIRADVIAKSPGVWAGEGLCAAVEAVAQDLGLALTVRERSENGASLEAGDRACEWSGSARAILALERPFLNLAAYVGGIATATRRLVDLVEARWKSLRLKGASPRVTATRKTLPGYRDIAIQGVLAGGGFSHRVSLSGGILIKENHIASTGGIARAIDGVRACAPHGLKIEIEVRDLKELEQALASRVDGVLLDNFSPRDVTEAIRKIGKSASGSVFVEVSGGIGESNIAEYVQEGIHVLSCGGLTHSVRALDLSMLVRSKGR